MDYNPQNKIELKKKKKISPQNTCFTMSLRGWRFYFMFIWVGFFFFFIKRLFCHFRWYYALHCL